MRKYVLCVALVLTAACGGGSGKKTQSSATTTTAPASASAGSQTTLGGITGAAATQACLQDARIVQDASNAYIAAHGKPAPSMDALVQDGHLKSAPTSDHYTIGYDPASGMVTASGACNFG